MSAPKNEAYLIRFGKAVDECLNVLLFNGEPDETISYHAAVAQTQQKRWACILCKILDVVIEPDHCAKQFDDLPTQPAAALRSFVAMAALVLPVLCGLHLMHTLAIRLL